MCAQRVDGDMFCWGANDNGEIDLPADLIADDCTADADSFCVIEADKRAHGNLELAGDVDWFSVEMEPGVSYKVYLDGSMDAHAVADPQIVGLYDSSGVLRADTTDADSGTLIDALTLFEHSELAAATFSVGISSQDGGVGDYWLWVSRRTPGSDVSEGSLDLPPHAGTPGFVTVGGTATGTIESRSGTADVDAFGMVFEAGRSYRIDVLGDCTATPSQDGGSLVDPSVKLRRPDGTKVFTGLVDHLNAVDTRPVSQFADKDSGACSNAQLELEALADGLHYIAVFAANSSDEGTYTVAVEEIM